MADSVQQIGERAIASVTSVAKKTYSDATDIFNGLSKKQQIACYGASTFVSLCLLLKVKGSITQRRLRRQGYRLCDLSAQIYHISQDMGCSPTVSGFEVCSDTLTADHLKEMSRELMRSFINFRSQLYKIGNEWYYKEEFDPETASMDDYVITVPLSLDDEATSSDDDDAEIEEKMLQRVVEWLNENRAFNIKWTEYERAHFDMIYFHFQSLGKCVFYFRFDHALGDGILIASLVALFQNYLYNPLFSQQTLDWTKTDDVLNLVKVVRTEQKSKPRRPSMSTTLRRTLYRYMHYPVAFLNFVHVNLAMNLFPVPKCAYFGEFGDSNQMVLGRRLPLSAFKSVANSNGGTVNDLFMAISVGSLRRYALKMECPVFASDSYAGHCSKLGIASYRPLEHQQFTEEIRQFAVEGTNANKLDLVPFRMNAKQVDVSHAQKAFNAIKYGAQRPVMRYIVDKLGSVPGGRRAQLEALRDVVLMTSNVRGSTQPIPIPTEPLNAMNGKDEPEQDKDVGAEDGIVKSFFGMAVPGFLPINYTVVSYNDYIRVGLITNSGTIKDPKVLMQCFVEEWEDYENRTNAM